jgi:hypothetical protein
MQTFRFNAKVRPRANAAAFVELCESPREFKKMSFDESMFVICFMQALPRDAYRLLLKYFSDKLDDKGADSLSITNMVSSTIFFYETDFIKDNKIKEAHSIISTKELKKMKILNAAQ